MIPLGRYKIDIDKIAMIILFQSGPTPLMTQIKTGTMSITDKPMAMKTRPTRCI
jgi:hypothetical protein